MARGRAEKPSAGSVREDLRKGEFRRVYLLYGEEAYLRQALRQALRDAIVGGDEMNFLYLEGKNTDPQAIIDAALTMPFFAERRLIMAENTGFFKKDAGPLADFMAEIPETACIVFVEAEVDKRNRLYKAVGANGLAEECGRQTRKQLEEWAAVGLARSGKKIARSTMSLFLDRAGEDMGNIRQELEKLITYTGERDVVTREDVEAITTQQISGKIFEMVEAIGMRQRERALALYYDLYALKEPPVRILFLIAQQMQSLLQVKDMQEKRMGKQAIMSRTGWWYSKADSLIQQAGRFREEELESFFARSMELSEAVRRGDLQDSLAVEMLIVDFTG